MDREYLKDRLWDEGKLFLQRLVERHFPVAVAFWGRKYGIDSCHLYIASSRVDQYGLRQVYGEINDCLSSEAFPSLDPLSITLLKSEDPVARSAVELRNSDTQRMPGYYLLGAHHGGPLMGGTLFEDVWIYPEVSEPSTTAP